MMTTSSYLFITQTTEQFGKMGLEIFCVPIYVVVFTCHCGSFRLTNTEILVQNTFCYRNNKYLHQNKDEFSVILRFRVEIFTS